MTNEISPHCTIIVGSGLAGLSAALALAEKKIAVVLISRFAIGGGTSSAWAQGGIAAAVGDDDQPALHAADTMAAGAGICDAGIVSLVTGAAPGAVEWLRAQGVAFDVDETQKLKLGLEGAHSRRRIVHAHGDGTGAAIVAALAAKVRATEGIEVIESVEVVGLAKDAERVVGVWVRRYETDGIASAPTLTLPQGGREFLFASDVVLATGGVGGLWRHTTNPVSSTGQGLALAAQAGAVLRDVEFMQFHPTAMDVRDENFGPMPLASEALRGEGATLCNDLGENFLAGLPQGALSPRDVVARAIWAELQKGRKVFLDARMIADFAKKFPAIYAFCKAAGIDPMTQAIPVHPAAHYHMGGLKVDEFGRSSVAGLWACGEVASTGLQGANRLASNSLLEAVVMGRLVAAGIGGNIPEQPVFAEHPPPYPYPRGEGDFSVDVRRVMSAHVGVLRDREGLETAVAALKPLAAQSDMALVGLMIATAALRREESRGAQARVDFAQADETWRMHQDVRVEILGGEVFVVSKLSAVDDGVVINDPVEVAV